MAPRTVLPRKHRWHGVGNVDGQFAVETETFLWKESPFDFTPQTRYRPKKLAGAVWDVGGRNRGQLQPLAELNPAGVQDLASPTFAIAGHLMAVCLTGVDEPENLVSVSKFTNDRMEEVERAIAKLALQPLYLELRVKDYYDDRDARIPKSFEYLLYKLDRSQGLKTWTVQQDWLQPLQYNFDQQMIAFFAKIDQHVRSTNWGIENVAATPVGNRDLRFLKGHLPPLDDRPYAFLDYWLIELKGCNLADDEVLAYIQSIGVKGPKEKRKNFEQPARKLALMGCILRHNNLLISDVYGKKDACLEVAGTAHWELHRVLIEGGGFNAPQVDHILPDNLGGATCLSNAQITSMQYNSAKQDTTDKFEFRDDQWKQEALKKLLADPKLAPFT